MQARALPARIGIRSVLDLAWPICISMLSYTAMTVADSIFVGRLGTAPLAAIGISAAVIHSVTAFGHGLIGGMRVSVARCTGARRPDEARVYAWQGLWVAAVIGVACMAMAPIGPWIFPMMGATAEVSSLASDYYAIRTLSAPLMFGFVALEAWFQGRGNTRVPMYANVAANALNIALDPILIFGWGPVPAMGMEGAAIATAIAWGFGGSILAIATGRELLAAVSGPSRSHLVQIWRIGAPTGLQHILNVLSFGVFVSLLAFAGDVHLAAHVVAVRIAMVSFLPGYAIGEASGVLVGHALGANKPELARQANRSATILALILMAACGLVFVLLPGPLVGVFGTEPSVASIARTTLLVAAALQIIDAIATVALGSLAGAGDTRFVMVVTVAATWGIQVPVAAAMVLGAGLGAPGAWIGITTEVAVLAVICVARVRGTSWLEQVRLGTEHGLEADVHNA
jgi:MATE family multidrug resistance protein